MNALEIEWWEECAIKYSKRRWELMSNELMCNKHFVYFKKYFICLSNISKSMVYNLIYHPFILCFFDIQTMRLSQDDK